MRSDITGLIYILYLVITQLCAEDINVSKEIDKILNSPDVNFKDIELKRNEEDYGNELDAEYDMEKEKEKEAGDIADLFGTNQHYSIPVNYQDLGRRFVPSFPYYEKENAHDAAETKLHNIIMQHLEDKKVSDARLRPVKAPPEFVLSIAKQSALLEAAKPRNPTDDLIKKNVLRTGDYWDDVWKEEVDENEMLRSGNRNNNNDGSITVEISSGSKLYDLITALKGKSPRLLYVINNSD